MSWSTESRAKLPGSPRPSLRAGLWPPPKPLISSETSPGSPFPVGCLNGPGALQGNSQKAHCATWPWPCCIRTFPPWFSALPLPLPPRYPLLGPSTASPLPPSSSASPCPPQPFSAFPYLLLSLPLLPPVYPPTSPSSVFPHHFLSLPLPLPILLSTPALLHHSLPSSYPSSPPRPSFLPTSPPLSLLTPPFLQSCLPHPHLPALLPLSPPIPLVNFASRYLNLHSFPGSAEALIPIISPSSSQMDNPGQSQKLAEPAYITISSPPPFTPPWAPAIPAVWRWGAREVLSPACPRPCSRSPFPSSLAALVCSKLVSHVARPAVCLGYAGPQLYTRTHML